MRFLKDPVYMISSLILGTAIMLQVVLPIYAQDSLDGPGGGEAIEDIVCLEEVAETAAALTKDAVDYFAEHYQADQANSTLIDGAFVKFDEYQTRMVELVEQFGAAQGGKNLYNEFEEREDCLDFINDQIRTVERMLINHNVQTAGGKKSHKLVTKLKEVNEKMKALNKNFGEMYGGFKAFTDKLQNTVK
jgi:hypothetical protein